MKKWRKVFIVFILLMEVIVKPSGHLFLVVSVVVTKQHQNLLREFMLKVAIFIHNSGQQPLANSLIR